MPWTPDSVAAPAAVAVAAGVMLVVAWRGRRVNDHPICRRCGFDLVGRPSDSINCSECGADLRRRRAIQIGARRRAPRLVAAALLLLVPSIVCLGLLGWSAASDVSFIHHKPVWWLLNDASSSDAAARDAAFNELIVRLRSGRLSDAQLADVVGRALSIQADRRRTWLPEWGDLVEEAYRAEKMPAERWRTYVRQAPQLELTATSRFPRGGRGWIELIERPTRVGNRGELVLRLHRRVTITDAAGARFERDFGWVNYTVGGWSTLRGGWSLPLNDGVIGFLADGPQRATVEVVVEAYESATLATRGRPVATTKLNLWTTWIVDPAAAPESGVAAADPAGAPRKRRG